MGKFLWWGSDDKKIVMPRLKETIPFPIVDLTEKIDKKEKIALVLPGGGMKGRWQIGALYWFYQLGLLDIIDMVVGTSVGGLNTLLVAKHRKDFKGGLALWDKIKVNKDVYDGMLQFGNFFDALGMVGQVFKSNKGKCILNPKGLYKILEEEFGDTTLDDYGLEIVMTASNISTVEMEEYYSGGTKKYGAAELAKRTSAIPIMFPAVPGKSNDDLHVDGGVGNNTPIETAIKFGATKIMVIGTCPKIKPPRKVENNIMSVGGRVATMVMEIFEEKMWDTIEQYELRTQVDSTLSTIEFMKLYPAEDTGDSLDANNHEQLQKGYDLAVKYIIKKKISDFLLA